MFDFSTETLTFSCSPSKPEGAYDLNVGDNDPEWSSQNKNIKKVVFDASFANARPTTCCSWFQGCINLTEIKGIENLNTQEVTDMVCMFSDCYNLKSLDLSNFDTQNVTNMSSMFGYCSGLTSLNVSKFDTQKVTDMVGMFSGCSSLKSLDLSNFDTRNVTSMGSMFFICSSLKSLDLSNFNTAKVTGMKDMFAACSELTSLDLTSFNTAKVTDMSFMFSGCSALTTIYATDNFVTDQVIEDYYMFDGCKSLKDYADSKINHNYANCTTGYFTPGCGYAMFDDATETLTFSYKGVKPKGAYDLNKGVNYLAGWYQHTSNIKKVVFDASFANARPTNCNEWFSACYYLTTIEGIEYLNTQKVTDMGGMFYGCSSLKSLDLSNFDTRNVTSMGSMFNFCSALESLDLTNFNTTKVTDMESMFCECNALTSLDLTKFNTAKVTNMNSMFYRCSALTSLDLTNFNTAKVTDMESMFYGCNALTTIYATDNFVTDQVTSGDGMFYSCENLKGAIDKYNYSKNDHKYANYKTGYFSKLVGKNGDEKIGASGETLTAASLALNDEKDFVAYEPFTATTATYSREMKTGTTWATLCLPFEVSLADRNFRAFKLLSANESTSTIQLEEITTSIAAGTPVIIKMNNGETTLSISEANKDIAQKVVSAADGNYQLQGLYTKKVFDKDADNNCYIVKGDKLMNPTKLLENTSTTQVGCKPFRAYMVDNTSSSAGAKMFSIAIGDNTTAIDSLNTIADGNAIYYDLQGNRLNAPQKGINIVKRGSKTTKVIIK